MGRELSDEVLNDELAISLAQMMAVANKRALEFGINARESIITIDQRVSGAETIWRVNYGPKNYLTRRGGGLVIEMDPKDASIKKVLRGQ